MVSTCPARDSGTHLTVFSASFPFYSPLFFLMLGALRALVVASSDMVFFPLGKTHVLFPQKRAGLSTAFPSYSYSSSPSLWLLSVPQDREDFKVWWVRFSGKLWFVSFVYLIVPFQRWLGLGLGFFFLEGEQAACFEWSALLYLVITLISKLPIHVHTKWDCQPNELLKFNWVL